MVGLGNSEFFFKGKPVLAITALNDTKTEWYASSLAKEIDCTFPHIIKVLARFEALGLVSFKASGRKKVVVLTNKGHKLAEGLLAIVSFLK
jgi:DNA-binding MarR family transcriptional regulator